MSWDLARENLFQAEIVKMFLAYNKTVVKATLEAKSSLMCETLENLDTSKIQSFFKFIRETCETMPSDGALKKILRENHKKFSIHNENTVQIEDKKYLSNDEKMYLKQCGINHPDFKDLFDECLEDDDRYPTQEWGKKFWERVTNKTAKTVN